MKSEYRLRASHVEAAGLARGNVPTGIVDAGLADFVDRLRAGHQAYRPGVVKGHRHVAEATAAEADGLAEWLRRRAQELSGRDRTYCLKAAESLIQQRKHAEAKARSTPKAAPKPTLRACPKCRRKKGVSEYSEATLYCHDCAMQFDRCPDEGGDYDDRNPAARLERAEREKERR